MGGLSRGTARQHSAGSLLATKGPRSAHLLRYGRDAVRLLALDFDGVISDSAPEAFVVAMRCFAALRPDGAMAAAAAPLSGESAPTPDSVSGHGHYAPFLALMPLGNRAEDYAVMLSSLEEEREIRDQDGYDAYRAELDPAWLRQYHKHFYRVRADLAAADPSGWLSLMRPYEPLLGVLRRRAADALLCIATAKDRGSVRKLLRAYGIDDLFGDECVLDKEAGVLKSEHLAVLHQRHAVPYPEITFVDDKVRHLADASALGVRCALASWGFNGPREAEEARAAGFLVCSLADFERQLFGAERGTAP